MSPNKRHYFVDELSFLEPAYLEVDESFPLPPNVGKSKCFTGVMHDYVELVEIPIGPPMALRLTVPLAADAEPAGSQREFVDLLEALDDLDRALGGNGVVVDASLSGGTRETLTVVLRPRNPRWSLDRFTEAAELLLGGPASRTVEPPPVPLNGEHVAAVTSLFERRGPINKESAHDRVRNWRGKQKSLAGLQVELLQGQTD